MVLWACALVNSPTACYSCLLPQLSPQRPPVRAGTGRRNVTWRGRKMFLQLCLRFERVELDWTWCLCHRSLYESSVLALTAPLFLCCLCIHQDVFFFLQVREKRLETCSHRISSEDPRPLITAALLAAGAG